MNRTILLALIVGLILAYGYQLEQIDLGPKPLSLPDAVQPLDPKEDAQDSAQPPQIQDFGEVGYCGAKLPKGFRRPTLGTLLNQDRSRMGNTARQLYNQGKRSSLQKHLDKWQGAASTSPLPSLWKAVLHIENMMPSDALPYLSQAMELADEKATIALFLGNILSHTSQLADAIDALAIYLEAYPQDSPKRQQLARLKTQHEIQERYERIEDNGVELLYPPEASQLDWASLLDTVDTKLEEAAEFTGTARRQTLTVIGFEGKAELLATTCVPTWTGGVYDGSIKLAMPRPTRLPSPVTLAHETLHAQLSYAVRGHIPAWFSGGMAQAFAREEPRAQDSWRKMVEHQTYIPFTSLGDSFLEFEGSDDARLAYHQGLAMVLWLYDTAGTDGLHEAVTALKAPKERQKLLLELFLRENDSDDFLEFVSTLID